MVFWGGKYHGVREIKNPGLTTAAGLWTSACIGLVMGIGFFECGVIATVAVYIIIGYFKKLEDRITFYDGWFSVYVRVEDPSCLRISMMR